MDVEEYLTDLIDKIPDEHDFDIPDILFSPSTFELIQVKNSKIPGNNVSKSEKQVDDTTEDDLSVRKHQQGCSMLVRAKRGRPLSKPPSVETIQKRRKVFSEVDVFSKQSLIRERSSITSSG